MLIRAFELTPLSLLLVGLFIVLTTSSHSTHCAFINCSLYFDTPVTSHILESCLFFNHSFTSYYHGHDGFIHSAPKHSPFDSFSSTLSGIRQSAFRVQVSHTTHSFLAHLPSIFVFSRAAWYSPVLHWFSGYIVQHNRSGNASVWSVSSASHNRPISRALLLTVLLFIPPIWRQSPI